MNDYERRLKNRENERQERRARNRRRAQIWLVVGVVVLITLLFFWVDIADMLGWGDGAA
jgi:type VI protein secretion system component VasF